MIPKYSLGIVIVNWNNEDVILDCLRSIQVAGFISSVVIVDNASSDGSLINLKSQISPKEFQRNSTGQANIKIIRNKENLGYSGGNNCGIKFLLGKGAKYILILNPDTEVEKRAIARMLQMMEKDPTIGIAGPKIFDKEGKIWSCGGEIDKKRFSGGLIGLGKKDTGQYDKELPVDYISGTAIMVKREVFEEIGLFNEDYFAYYEDVELCWRAKQKNFKIIFVPNAIICHKASSSFGQQAGKKSFYMARNHLLFVERNAPILIKARELIRLPKTIWEHLSKKDKFALLGIRDYFLWRFGPPSRKFNGLLDLG